MGMTAQRIITTLWFDGNAEDAAEHYCSIFDDARIVGVVPYPEGTDKAGSAMTVEFELLGQRYVGLNGGPQFTFNEAISLQVQCRDQAEIDRYWDALLEGGEAGACGWLKDRYGLSWQIVPESVDRYFAGDAQAAARAIQAMFGMRKLDIAALEAARAGA